MLRNRLYYRVKPFVPASLRVAVRRWFALRKRARVGNIWPILPGSEKPPAGWPGWPDGKQFAVVLTHDVEGPEGLARCRQLMKLEMDLGFRSSFNFIPEGDYRVPRDLIEELKQKGFEIGVHDLNHDGKLYRSRAEFAAKAVRINQHLKNWGAVGFRSGFMHHNLPWMHDLDVQYDSSTFDTDPFEPQPDGVGTIFPFWVPNPDLNLNLYPNLNLSADTSPASTSMLEVGRSKFDVPSETHPPSPIPHSLDAIPHPLHHSRPGYVELPYTLPQDSTLFLLFQEKNIDIWKTKLDWIAEHGGMMLVDVHPDYVSFDGSVRAGSEYDCSHYREFLQYISRKHKGRYWRANPGQLAGWYTVARRSSPSRVPDNEDEKRPLRGKKAAVLLYAYYPADPRPRREAEALVRAGVEVDLVCLRQNAEEASCETINGVHVRRVPMRRRRDSKLTYFLQYSSFVGFCAALLAWRSLWKRYDLVHAHNMPDALIFSGLVPKWRGAKLILDLHDPMPELMMSIYHLPPGHRLVRLLKQSEKRSIAFADLVLTANIAFQRLFVSRNCPAGKVQIVMNSPQETIFDTALCRPVEQAPAINPAPFRLMYHGLLVERHGLDTALEAIALLKSKIPGIEFHIFGERTPYMDQVQHLIAKLDLKQCVHYYGPKPQTVIAQSITGVHLGLVPNRRNPFTALNMPTRIFEYLAMDRPVIVPRTEGIQDYFAEDEILFFEPGDAADLAAKIEWVWSHPAEVASLVQKGRTVYYKHRWEQEQLKLVALVGDLLRKRPVPILDAYRDHEPRNLLSRPSGTLSSAPSGGEGVVSKRICMLSYSNYESDNRVMRYAEALGRRGDSVEAFALKSDPTQSSTETIGPVRVFRIQFRSRKNQQSKVAYLLPIISFWLLSSLRLTWHHLKRRYDVVHVHNVPDFLVFAAWLPRLTGAKIILDIHDIVPEFYASKFSLPSASIGVKMLKKVERASARFANQVIISNHLWLDTFASRTGANGKCSVFINNVDSTTFRPRPQTRKDGKLLVIFPGGLQSHQGLDIALRAFQKVLRKLPRAEFHIYGDGNMKDSLIALTAELGLQDKVRFFNPLPVSQIADVMANADLGVVPKRADSFGNEAYSTKIMEFMSLGVPVVVSSTKIDRYYFNDSVVRFFESGNPEALAVAMVEVLSDQNLRKRMVAGASEYAARNSWETCKQDYLDLVDGLVKAEN